MMFFVFLSIRFLTFLLFGNTEKVIKLSGFFLKASQHNDLGKCLKTMKFVK